MKLAFWRDFGVTSFRLFWVKFVAGALTIGGGCSLGREGPTVQLGANLASNLAPHLGVAKQGQRAACAAGAAAGLAAAFNTPLTGITFVLEEMVENLNSRLLGSMILASVCGAIVVHAFMGENPAFRMTAVEEHSWHVYLLVPIAAACAGLVVVAFQKLTFLLRPSFRRLQRVPSWFQPGLGGLVTWLL